MRAPLGAAPALSGPRTRVDGSATVPLRRPPPSARCRTATYTTRDTPRWAASTTPCPTGCHRALTCSIRFNLIPIASCRAVVRERSASARGRHGPTVTTLPNPAAGCCVAPRFPVLSCPTPPYPILPYHILSCPVLSYRYPSLSYPILSYPTVSYPSRSALKKSDGSFAPAHLLADGRLERSGRATKNVSGRKRPRSLCRRQQLRGRARRATGAPACLVCGLRIHAPGP